MESIFDNVDINEPGEWPRFIKVLAVVGLCIGVWAAGYYLVIKHKQAEFADLEQKEVELKSEFEGKQSKAINLEAYRKQMEQMRVTFTSMLKQLPRRSEVADLLVDISRTGLINGLEFELFKPGVERPMDFYVELPIAMKVTGNYHQLGQFVSGIADLPRIVTLHDLNIKENGSDSNKVSVDITAKTYRYFDDENGG